ncbi:ABC transporter permease [Halioglobus maricola]|uniref:ABC transporter permease n=1 Tax=Halioglobus maricola TaxID=2601894 RepID=A0A5P9NNB9_9GAMM|nr:FtsX-like permease family protein [Halioglobus maricola]QFU77149.1 ABC transporter permease [Halioglobus maricola]
MTGAIAVSSRLAWRNLWRNHRRTLIMLLAIGTGVWAMVFMSALMRGMTDQVLVNGLHNLPGEAQIHHPNYRADPSVVNSLPMPGGELLEALEAAPVTAWSARVRVPAVIASERESRGVTLLGVDPATEGGVDALPEEIIAGRFLEGVDDRGLVIGAALARRLDTQLGKRVVIMSQDPDNNVADRGTRVVGIYRARLQGTEEQFAYAGREVLQAMLSVPGQVSEVAVTGGDYRAVARWLPALQVAAGSELEVQSWMELQPFLDSMLEVQDGFTLIFMVVIFLALSFGLVNTLVMAVFERTREIGLQQALGVRPTLILQQFLLESLYLLLLGLGAGNLLAWLTIKPLESGIDISMVAEGMEMMGMGTTLYPALQASDMWMSTGVVIVLGLTASLLPAWRASRLDPVRALNKT